jgi:hypothetical protein
LFVSKKKSSLFNRLIILLQANNQQSALDMDSLSEALPKTPPKPHIPSLSRPAELELSEQLKDRPVTTAKRRASTPPPSPVVKPVTPLRPISPPKQSPLAAKLQSPPKAFSVEETFFRKPPQMSAAPRALLPTPTAASDLLKHVAKVAAPTAVTSSAAAAPAFQAAPFSFTSKPFSFSENKPVDFSFGGSNAANLFAPVQVAKQKADEEPSSLVSYEVEVVESGVPEEKQKIIEVNGKIKVLCYKLPFSCSILSHILF